MSQLTRRRLLVFFGGSVAATTLAPVLGQRIFGGDPGVAQALSLSFTPLRLPHPLPIYQKQKSYLPTGTGGQGQTLPASQDARLSSYTVQDDVVVPPEYERYVIVSWGDRLFPNPDEYFGYNNDYTGFIPVGRTLSDGYLWVNHEYTSYPISPFAPGTPEDVKTFIASGPLVISGFPTVLGRELLGELMYNQGGSILRITKGSNGRYAPASNRSKNRRLHGLSGLGINSQRSDQYKTVTSWGTKSYQKGDQNYLIGTGPAATQVFAKSADGLGNRIIGTAFNCSGGTTPWGTILSCEENFQGSSLFFVGVTESVKPDGTQTGYTTGTTGAEFGLVGEKYGWVVEIDPANPDFRPRKHTALGRVRWENVAIRAEAGKKLVLYLGDDRRGGHTWKYVSAGTIQSVTSKENSKLLESGTVYAARYNPDGTGQWVPLTLGTPTNPIAPSVLASEEVAKLGTATRDGLLRLPSRIGIAGTVDGGAFSVTRANEATVLPGYKGKTLKDFYANRGALLCDAFLAANLAGATPTARPEDLEVHPQTKEVFIAYTDNAPGSDGYPDSRIFTVSKYTTAVNDAQQSGGIYKIIENSADGTGNTFRWAKLSIGGEAGAEDGAGFGNVDNLAIDNRGNLWGVTDMSTGTHNGFDVGAAKTENTIDHKLTGDVSTFTGVFGNNFLFYVPIRGPQAGEIVPFAYGPTRCEITGPTFVGSTLIASVQHPGEDCPYAPKETFTRTIEILNLDGTLFNQTRTVSRGSNWPSNIQGKPDGPPKPSVIGIQRKPAAQASGQSDQAFV